mgnify:FL=1
MRGSSKRSRQHGHTVSSASSCRSLSAIVVSATLASLGALFCGRETTADADLCGRLLVEYCGSRGARGAASPSSFFLA